MEEKAPESYMYKYPVQESYHVKKLLNGERGRNCLMVIFVLFRAQSRYLINRAVLTAIILSMEIKVKFNIYSFFVCVCNYMFRDKNKVVYWCKRKIWESFVLVYYK